MIILVIAGFFGCFGYQNRTKIWLLSNNIIDKISTKYFKKGKLMNLNH